ncbi:ATP-binding protein [Gemmatimonadota bacterium]
MTLGIRSKIFGISILLILIAGFGSGIFLQSRLQMWMTAEIESELLVKAQLARGIVAATLSPGSIEQADALADSIAYLSGTRVTIISRDGTVLGDSDLTSAEVREVENHADRHEIRQALEVGRGQSSRFSTTLGTTMLYVALRLGPTPVSGIVRLATPIFQVEAARRSLRGFFIVAGVIGLAMALLMSALVAQMMSRTLRNLARTTSDIAGGNARRRIAPASRDEIAGLAGSVNSITEQLERTIGTLASERNRFEAVLDSMGEAVIALDSGQRITMVNQEALSLLGLRSEPLGRSLMEAIRAPVLQDLLDRSRSGDAVDEECDLLGARPLRVHVRVTPLRADGGSVIVLHDVTELRRLESVRRDFVANVSHELRTPVSVIRANAETLLDAGSTDADRTRQFLEAVLRNAERLSNLVSDLLDISRIEAGEYVPGLASVSLRRAFARVEGAVHNRSDSMNQTVSTRLENDLEVLADSQALDQILINLLDNAISYCGEGSHIELNARRYEDQIRIEVRDDGPGIEPRHAERIFERFYRVDEGRSREAGGTGLGLSIVKHLVEAMGGQVGYESNAPTGSVFWLLLDSAEN